MLRPWTPSPAVRTLVSCTILRASDLPLWLNRSPSWRPAVNRSIVVLGSWSDWMREDPKETTRSAEQLREMGVEVLLPPRGGWRNQVQKRSAYFERLAPGEVGFVIDADETLSEGPDALRQAATAAFDVGWVTIEGRPRYALPYGQPRLFLSPPEGLVYRNRHYWVFSRRGGLVAGHSYGGTGWLHERLPLTLVNRGGPRRPGHQEQYRREGASHRSILDEGRKNIEALRIAQVTTYDAGLAVYRLHSAINSTTRERSLMLSDHTNNPLRGPTQYSLADREQAKQIISQADVVHCHLDYTGLGLAYGHHPDQAVVIHHHGTVYRRDPETANRRDTQASLRLASTMNLLLLDETKTLQWLPNPVPVSLYSRMAAAARAVRRDGEVWIAHSPSKPKLKGTEDLVAAVERLRARHLPVRLQMTTGVPHREALWQKASCDIMFDSFWLGIQVSGIEAAAMGMPVVAGDEDTAQEYLRRLGATPYTFAAPADIEKVIERLVVDTEWRKSEAARVGAYVLEYHDDAAVALRYLELLLAATKSGGKWRDVLSSAVRAERKVRATALRQEVVPPQKPIPGSHFRMGKRTR